MGLGRYKKCEGMGDLVNYGQWKKVLSLKNDCNFFGNVMTGLKTLVEQMTPAFEQIKFCEKTYGSSQPFDILKKKLSRLIVLIESSKRGMEKDAKFKSLKGEVLQLKAKLSQSEMEKKEIIVKLSVLKAKVGALEQS